MFRNSRTAQIGHRKAIGRAAGASHLTLPSCLRTGFGGDSCEQPARVEEAKTLREVLERIGGRGRQGIATPSSIGQRTLVPSCWFRALLVSSLSALPGFGSLMAFIVFLFGCQLVLGRKCAWMPLFFRTIERRRLDRAMRFLEPAARLSDEWYIRDCSTCHKYLRPPYRTDMPTIAIIMAPLSWCRWRIR